MISIGQAYPSISYLMVDQSDNITRMYPQALLKQYTYLQPQPKWNEYDIIAQFNSELDWHFINSPDTINSYQLDFLINTVHELIHGLGLMTSWTDDLYQYFSPYIGKENKYITPHLLDSDIDDIFGDTDNIPQTFLGFVEFPFDKLIYFKTNIDVISLDCLYPFTNITRQLNKFSDESTLFADPDEMAHAWSVSEEIIHASYMYDVSTTESEVVAVVDNEPLVWLESSIKPFLTGSSLCHFDQSMYLNSSEYLMIYLLNQGIDLHQLEIQYPEGPIGPKLLNILAAIGYNISEGFSINANIKTLRPSLEYWTPSFKISSSEADTLPSHTLNNGNAHNPHNTPSMAGHPSTCITLYTFSFLLFLVLYTI
ncbi:hypothetical protein BDB01DRAFT_720963 [Pilobolus umbonatus]|nr:hypothetical protein BDB01DRAFT_720963 [Pilobolus umbonatus]